jgi:hypothetical protein
MKISEKTEKFLLENATIQNGDLVIELPVALNDIMEELIKFCQLHNRNRSVPFNLGGIYDIYPIFEPIYENDKVSFIFSYYRWVEPILFEKIVIGRYLEHNFGSPLCFLENKII